MTQELIIAACLVLVIEGALPFLAPDQWRKMVLNVAALPAQQIRIVGLASMLLGVALLYVFN